MKKDLMFGFIFLFLVGGIVFAETYVGDGEHFVNFEQENTFIADNGWKLDLISYEEISIKFYKRFFGRSFGFFYL
jgi:hypothetical protein